MPGPCTGLTVLDFSWGMPGALCTLVMADFGADVIKVEPPGGDPFRFQPAWISWNRGKKSVQLDLGTTEGIGNLNAPFFTHWQYIPRLTSGQSRDIA